MSQPAMQLVRRRSISDLIDPLVLLPGVHYQAVGAFEDGTGSYFLPRFTFRGGGGGDPIRIGVFAAIHGDEPAGALAAAALLREAALNPGLVADFILQVYPLCNPTGYEDNTRHSRRGRDLNREFWKGSVEPEVQILEHELRHGHFQGLIQLHADDTSSGVYGFVRGHTLTENLLRPALCAASKILPRNECAVIDGFAARDGIIYDAYEGILAAPAEMDPLPFEIVLETPHHAPEDLQVQAFLAAMRTIVHEYRELVSFAANI